MVEQPAKQTKKVDQMGSRVSTQRNPLDMQGNPTICQSCQFVYHYARDCPYSYEHGEKLLYNVKDRREKFACADKHDLTRNVEDAKLAASSVQ